ncbi:DUF742 domain-containing protein [Phytomonospora endophytica]|nr:DUF742 domain-containing protein [Phytomonospora endophytica]GIG67752.1 hypothetical protein Pen01_40470 [Phytomonospora endophytica]
MPARLRTGLVRSHTPTGGRADPARSSLNESTLLYPDLTVERAGLPGKTQQVMEFLAPGALAVAEVAAYLRLPLAVVKVLAADLITSGHIVSRTPVPAEQQHDCDLLERILHGLEQL